LARSSARKAMGVRAQAHTHAHKKATRGGLEDPLVRFCGCVGGAGRGRLNTQGRETLSVR
jgi:hypothetical protein